MVTITERLSILELKVSALTKAVYILSATLLGTKLIPEAIFPILNLFAALFK